MVVEDEVARDTMTEAHSTRLHRHRQPIYVDRSRRPWDKAATPWGVTVWEALV